MTARKTAAEKAAEAAEAPEVKADETPEAPKGDDTKALDESPEVVDGVSADVRALREAHANLPVLEVKPTNDGEETQAEVLERLSRERKAQQLASDLVPDNAPDAE
jgi:hypothetical protein